MAWIITDLETAISNIELVITGRITADVESYSIAGRQITKIPISELFSLKDRLKSELENLKAAQRIEDGEPSKRKILIRFI